MYLIWTQNKVHSEPYFDSLPPKKIMSTNYSKRAYEEEVSEDDQYFIDRALEIKARVEKYYDNHPEEYKELLELEEADRLKKTTRAKTIIKIKEGISTDAPKNCTSTRSRTYMEKKISHLVNSQEVMCDYCYKEKGITRTYTPSFLERHQAGKKCALSRNKDQFNKDCTRVSRSFFDECEDEIERSNFDVVNHFEEFDEPDVFKLTFVANAHYASASDAIDKLHDIENGTVTQINEMGVLRTVNRYLQYQECFYDATYGLKCLGAKSFEEMINIVKSDYSNKFDKQMIDNISIYLFWIENQLSRQGQEDYLKLHHKLCMNDGIGSTVPQSTLGVSYKIKQCLSLFKYGTLQIEWPPGWNMDTFNGLTENGKQVELYLRDPMELISELFINPEIMFKYKNSVRFDYFDCSDNSYGDVMCSKWCKNSEALVRGKNANGKILPLIFYSDGVQLNDRIHNNVTPVMCTTGNFSDDLITKDISKCVIGYLPNLLNTKAALFDHLCKMYSRSKAELEVRRFDLLVEREYWKEIVKGLKSHWENGIQMHVLGEGIKTFYPCVAFFVGDDPQQHRQAGLETGNCIHGCTYCTYSYKDGIYNEEIHRPRDNNDIIKRCCEAERSLCEQGNGQAITKSEENNIKYLKAQNIHPFVNPFFFAPMGDPSNNIFRATPPDLLHNFCAGLMKSLVKSIISIIYAVSKINEAYVAAANMFDWRIMNFGYVTEEMPHVHWTYFKEGIMRYIATNTAERSHSTGSFGGYKSTSFISLLIQMHYAIGHDSKILPGANFVLNKDNQIVDIQGRVQRAICSVLDCYFDGKRAKWDDKALAMFSKKVKNLYTHYMLVWDLNVSLLSFNMAHTKICKQRNPHKIFHLEDTIRYYGSLNHCDTSSWESIHRSVTKGVYSSTSKRNKTTCLEMLLKYNLNNHSKHLHRIAKIHLESNKIVDFMKPERHDDCIHFSPLDHHTKVPFILNYSTRELQMNTSWDRVTTYEPINTVSKFLAILYELDFASAISHGSDIDWRNEETMSKYLTKFVRAIKYESDSKTSLGIGKLFATPRGNIYDVGNENKPKYDFALVRINVDLSLDDSDRDSLSDGRSRRSKRGDDRMTTTVLLKLLVFILIEKKETTGHTPENHIFCLGQELYPKSGIVKNKKTPCLGKQFCWAAHPLSKTKFKYHLIPVESIIRIVLVVPTFKSSPYKSNKPKHDDTFHVLDRIFFDRTGWDEDVVQEEFFVQSTAEQISFMARWSLGNIPSTYRSGRGVGEEEDENDDGIFDNS